MPIVAKIEKPQAVERIGEILEEVQAIMVARGDLGVEMSPERVPMIQKRIIELCNRKGLPVITATQMLDSMIREARPTRAEASDVANAIIDGTDALMLSGETAAGAYPIRSVEMMARIAREVESRIELKTYPPSGRSDAHALSTATQVLATAIDPRCIIAFTASGNTAKLVAAERPKAPVFALTTDSKVYHGLNLVWGIKPLLVANQPNTFEELIALADSTARQRNLARSGERILVLGGIPSGNPGGTNFVKIHEIEGSP